MKYLLILIVSLSSLSCNLLRVTPKKDAQMIADVMEAKQVNHELYTRIMAAPNKTYPLYAVDYGNIHARWDTLVVKNEVRKHAKKILKQCKLGLQNEIELEQDHKIRVILTMQQLKENDMVAGGGWKALLVSELSLKN